MAGEVAVVWPGSGRLAGPFQACARRPSSESLFIFRPFELIPWSIAKGGGEVFFETTELWFHPKKEGRGGQAQREGE